LDGLTDQAELPAEAAELEADLDRGPVAKGVTLTGVQPPLSRGMIVSLASLAVAAILVFGLSNLT
jgi:hypothetical protein